MENNPHKTAAYKVIPTLGGRRYQFLCDLSGMFVCETGVYSLVSPEKELEAAWLSEGKKNFNLCQKCGRWVDTVMFNPDVFECVNCAPIESNPKYCPFCGEKITTDNGKCEFCGRTFLYGEGDADDYIQREKMREYFGFGTKQMKKLKVCGICGTAVSSDRQFCTKCNSKLPDKTLYDIYKSNHRYARLAKRYFPTECNTVRNAADCCRHSETVFLPTELKKS